MGVRDSDNDASEAELCPFEMGYLPEKFVRKAQLELCDSQENRTERLQELKAMMKDDVNLQGRKFEDDFLLQCLRVRKFNVPKALRQLQALVNLSIRCPSVFSDFKFERLVVNIRRNIFTFLPWRCPDGCALILIKLDHWDPEEMDIDDLKRMVAIYILQALRDPMTQVNGFKIIFDVKSNPAKHIRYATPSNVHLMYHGPLECAPGRFKAFHILNKSLTFKVAYFLLKPFLSNKIRQRVIFHSSAEELMNFFPRNVIPQEYGGTLANYGNINWLKNALQPESLASVVGWSQQC